MTAAAISAMATKLRDGFHQFNALNTHDDGVSLDSFVDWMQTAGYSLRVVEPYSRWRSEYEKSLRSLPEKVQRDSNEPILFQWNEPSGVTAASSWPSTARFDQLLRESTPFTDGVPHLSEAYLHHYLQQMTAIDLIPPPQQQSQKQKQGLHTATAAAASYEPS